MKGKLKGFYNLGNDFTCDFSIEKLPINDNTEYSVTHLGPNPTYGVVFDKAYIISPKNIKDKKELQELDNQLFDSLATMEHDALIIIASRASIDKIYNGFLTLFPIPEIHKLIEKNAQDYDTAIYAVYEANLINGQSILHLATASDFADLWPKFRMKLIEQDFYKNIQYEFFSDDLFNSYCHYLDEWFLTNTDLETCQAIYDTFKNHPLFKQKISQIVHSNNVKEKLAL